MNEYTSGRSGTVAAACFVYTYIVKQFVSKTSLNARERVKEVGKKVKKVEKRC